MAGERLARTLGSLDDLPEPVRVFYVKQEDGSFELQAEGIEDVSGLKKALKAERQVAKDLRKVVGLIPKELLEDVDALRARLVGETESEEEEEEEGKGKGADPGKGKGVNAAALRRKWEEEARVEREKMEETIKGLKSALTGVQLDALVETAALASGVNPKRVSDVMKVTKGQFELDEDGEPVVLDDDGHPTGKTLAKWFGGSFKDDRPWFFDATGSTGSSKSTETGQARTATGDEAMEGLTPEERMTRHREKHPVEKRTAAST